MLELSIILPVCAAIIGWLYTARRSRNLSKKQHTFNALLQASFNEKYLASLKSAHPYLDKAKSIDETGSLTDGDKADIRFLLNHYEFIAAGIRNGDIDELLFKDSERGTVVGLFETFEKYIYGVRDRRGRESVYEHIEWLYERWKRKPPGKFVMYCEWVRGRPFYGERNKIKS